MITKLTEEQNKLLPVYRDKWLAKGLNTDRIDRRLAIENFTLFNNIVLDRKTKPIVIFMDSPITSWLATLFLYNFFYKQMRSQVKDQVGNQVVSQVENQVKDQVENQVVSQVRNQVRSEVMSQVQDQVWNQVRSQVGSQMVSQMRSQVMRQVENQVENQVVSQVEKQVGSQVVSQVGNQVVSQVRNQVGNQVVSQVRSQLRSEVMRQVGSEVVSQVGSQMVSQVGSQVENQVKDQVWIQVGNQVVSQVENQVKDQVRSQIENQVGIKIIDFVYPYLGGNFDSGYFSFYDFMNKVLNVKFQCQEELDLYFKTADVSLIYPLNDFCVISEKPTDIKMKNSLLHNGKGAAISYADGFCVYALNGVLMQEWMVMTPAEKIDLFEILKIENVEVRRELLRKVGVERFVQKVGAKVLEKQGDYELLDIPIFPNKSRAIYLKMRNPSIGVWHLEGVSPDCETVEQAINWRAFGNKDKSWKPMELT